MNWSELKTLTTEELLDWAEAEDWCRAMAECQQDAEWHAEGDVWTHTKMVCRELSKLDEWTNLDADDRARLRFTALFHDAAKPLTTEVDPDTGRVRSPKHAVKGEFIARNALRDLGCDLETREEIARLARYHGRPAFLLERREPSHELAKLSWLVRHRLLYLFAVADTRGRTTKSMSRPEETLQYWKLEAESLDCWDKPYAFANDQARYEFCNSSNPNLHYVPFEEYKSNVTLVCGLPGAGKDTWLQRNEANLPVVSLDEIRAELKIEPTGEQGAVIQAAREQCREYLRAGTDFAFNATCTIRQTRKRWLDLFIDYGAHIRVVYVEPKFERLLAQNRSRDEAVPERVLRRLAGKCEPPTWIEAHSLLYVG